MSSDRKIESLSGVEQLDGNARDFLLFDALEGRLPLVAFLDKHRNTTARLRQVLLQLHALGMLLLQSVSERETASITRSLSRCRVTVSTANFSSPSHNRLRMRDNR